MKDENFIEYGGILNSRSYSRHLPQKSTRELQQWLTFNLIKIQALTLDGG
jgi:hypothetical protein